jgi:hypothetical protein
VTQNIKMKRFMICRPIIPNNHGYHIYLPLNVGHTMFAIILSSSPTRARAWTSQSSRSHTSSWPMTEANKYFLYIFDSNVCIPKFPRTADVDRCAIMLRIYSADRSKAVCCCWTNGLLQIFLFFWNFKSKDSTFIIKAFWSLIYVLRMFEYSI